MTTEMEQACAKATLECYSLSLLREANPHDKIAYIAYLEQAFKVGFADGALYAAEMARKMMAENDYANAMVKRDQVEPQWERDARTGARDPR